MNIAELRRRAEGGSTPAQVLLGICYLEGLGLDGEGVQVDHAEALRLLSGAAQQGVPRAAHYLGTMYLRGLGVPRDHAEAVRLFEVAAKGGEFYAEIALARMYARGDGVPADATRAGKWYAAAIAHERPPAGSDGELREAHDYLAARL